jgi:hypothetical protein
MYSPNTNVNCAVRNGKGKDIAIYKNTQDRTEFTEKYPIENPDIYKRGCE